MGKIQKSESAKFDQDETIRDSDNFLVAYKLV